MYKYTNIHYMALESIYLSNFKAIDKVILRVFEVREYCEEE